MHSLRFLLLAGKIVLSAAVIALLVYSKWHFVIKKAYNKELGDGGIQKLIDADRK